MSFSLNETTKVPHSVVSVLQVSHRTGRYNPNVIKIISLVSKPILISPKDWGRGLGGVIKHNYEVELKKEGEKKNQKEARWPLTCDL